MRSICAALMTILLLLGVVPRSQADNAELVAPSAGQETVDENEPGEPLDSPPGSLMRFLAVAQNDGSHHPQRTCHAEQREASALCASENPRCRSE